VDTPSLAFNALLASLLLSLVLVDALCYGRLLAYMRHTAVGVMVVPATAADRARTHNVVTAVASLVADLLTVASAVPSVAILVFGTSSAASLEVLLNYQLLFLFVSGVVVGVVLVGASADLRADVNAIRAAIARRVTAKHHEANLREDVYVIPADMQQ
jgi:hypothetical protein